ncbi:aminotransferase class IV [Lacihabitans lacunae]|uniref:Aminotransferase class IV n=1 Tax=Lacihabitans lacunae TaxID=1028214 RepID=A0ABV7Z4B3_9BACT
MSQFFESIKWQDGEFYLLDLHQKRVDRTMQKHFPNAEKIDLKSVLNVPNGIKTGLFKVKVIYDYELISVSFDAYKVKKHKQVKLVENDTISYAFKSTNRADLEKPMHGNVDFDDVIFVKNGLLSDASYSNIVFFDNQKWYTPMECLFEGVKRKSLLNSGKIEEKSIKVDDLKLFSKIAFVNAMRDFEYVYDFELNGNQLYLKESSCDI